MDAIRDNLDGMMAEEDRLLNDRGTEYLSNQTYNYEDENSNIRLFINYRETETIVLISPICFRISFL